jgi:hypothetical protein
LLADYRAALRTIAGRLRAIGAEGPGFRLEREELRSAAVVLRSAVRRIIRERRARKRFRAAARPHFN